MAISFDSQNLCECANAISATTAPEAGRERRFPEQPSVQGDWTFPATNRLLVDGGVMYRIEGWAHNPAFVTKPSAQLGGLNPAMISVTRAGRDDSEPHLSCGVDLRRKDGTGRSYYRVAASYITGAHAFKAGFNNGSGSTRTSTYNFQPVSYTFRDGVPQSLTQYATPYSVTTNLDNDLGVYVQDRWTKERLTLTLGVRYDFTNTSAPDQALGPGALVPNREHDVPVGQGVAVARHHAQDGRVVRPVRERRDRRQGGPQQVPGGAVDGAGRHPQSDQHARHDRDAHLERRQSRLRAELRAHDHQRQRRMPRVEQPELRDGRAAAPPSIPG